jgi:hypothetical protein
MFRLCSEHRQGQKYLVIKRCCYLTGDPAIAASQNGFCSHELSLHSKTNTFQNMTKSNTFFITFIFYHGAVVKPSR